MNKLKFYLTLLVCDIVFFVCASFMAYILSLLLFVEYLLVILIICAVLKILYFPIIALIALKYFPNSLLSEFVRELTANRFRALFAVLTALCWDVIICFIMVFPTVSLRDLFTMVIALIMFILGGLSTFYLPLFLSFPLLNKIIDKDTPKLGTDVRVLLLLGWILIPIILGEIFLLWIYSHANA